MLTQSISRCSESQNIGNYTEHMVKVYVRINATKKGTDFMCYSTLTEAQLTNVLDKVIRQNRLLRGTNVLQSSLQYVVEGHKISKENTEKINLREGSIIHALHTDNDVTESEITVTLRYQNSEQNVDVSHSIQVNPNKNIEDTVQQDIQLQFNKFFSEISLVYLGTEISAQKTFKQALIENNSEIIVIDKLKNGDQQDNGFKNAEELCPQQLGINFNKVKTVKPQEQIQLLGLQMPFNPRLLPQKVKKMLEENVMANEQQIQQRSRSLPTQLNTYVPSLIAISETQIRIPPQSQNQQEKMEEQKNIPTKSEIEEEKNSGQIDIEN